VAKLERSGLVERPSGDSHSARYRARKTVKKVVVVPGRLVNIVAI
jgi:hypothetical protein